MLSPELIYNPTIWLLASVVLVVLEGFDGSFSIFGTSSVAALITSITLHFPPVLHPLVVFGWCLVLSYVFFSYIFKATETDKDINDLD